MAKKSEYCFMLTATPLTNSPINLYWPLKICGEKWIGKEEWTKKEFVKRYVGGKQHKFFTNLIYPTEPTNIRELSTIKKCNSFIYKRKENVKTFDINFGEAPIKTSGNLVNYSLVEKLLGITKANDKHIIHSYNFFISVTGQYDFIF